MVRDFCHFGLKTMKTPCFHGGKDEPAIVLVIGYTKITEANGIFTECTYSLSIAKQEKPEELIRKVHFNHAHPSIKTDQPVPIFHLQYGGSMSTKMKD